MKLREIALSSNVKKKTFFSIEDIIDNSGGCFELENYIFEMDSFFLIFDLEVDKFSSKSKIMELTFLLCKGSHSKVELIDVYFFDLSKSSNKEIAKDFFNKLLIDKTKLLIHNASSDLRYIKNEFNIDLSESNYTCTMNDVNWRKYGYNSKNLEYLLFKKNLYFNSHNSLSDCKALLLLLLTHQNELTLVDDSMVKIQVVTSNEEDKVLLESVGFETYETKKVASVVVKKELKDAEIENLLHLGFDIKRIRVFA